MSCKDSMPIFSSWFSSLGKGLLVLDSQEDLLLLVSLDSELPLATSCVFSKVEDCVDMKSEHVASDDEVKVVVVAFPFLDDDFVKLMLPSFSLNVLFPT